MVFRIIIPQTRRHYKRFLLFFCVGTPRFPPESRRVPNDARPAAPGSVRFPGRPGAKADAQALHPAAASAFRTAYSIRFHRNPSAAKSKRPATRAFRAAERRSAPCQAIQSHTPQSARKPFRQAASNRLFKTVSVSFISPRLRLVLRNNKEDMPHFAFF